MLPSFFNTVGTQFRVNTVNSFNELVLFTQINSTSKFSLNDIHLSQICLKNFTSWTSFYGTRGSQLSRIILPNIQTISNGMVWDGSAAGLKLIDIGPTCTSIGRNAWYPTGVANKITVVVRAITPPTYGESTGYYLNPKALFVPYESLENYKTATNWSKNASVIYAIGGEEWVAQFGSSDEYADLTQQEYLNNYAL